MNINDLPKNSYSVVNQPKLNINDLPKDSYKIVSGNKPEIKTNYEGEENNPIQQLAINLIGRPVTRTIDAAIGAGIEAFGGDEAKSTYSDYIKEPKRIPILGTVNPAPQNLNKEGAIQLLKETGKSGLDIATLGSGAAVNNVIKSGIKKATVPLIGKVAPKSRVASNIIKNLPGPLANVTEGIAYNTATNVLNDRDAFDNTGVAGVLSAAIPPLITKGIPALGKAKDAMLKSDNIMNRVARLNPSDAREFKRLAGESHGSYLSKTGNFNNREDIVTTEWDKFLKSKQSVDDELALLPGRYQNKSIDQMIDGLIEREAKIGVEGSDTPIISNLFMKNKQGGLDMSEINELKRIYERTVKMDFVKQNLTEGVERAKRIDDSLRNWQVKQADELGFENLRELNKQTQIARFLVDKLGKEISGKIGNNAISLTDWIMLSGGDIRSISGFMTKKFFGSEDVQSGVAKLLAKGEPEGLIKPKIRKETQLNLFDQPTPSQPSLFNYSTQENTATTAKNKANSISNILPKIKNKVNEARDLIKKKGQGGYAEVYKGEKDLTTKILKDLEGKTTVSKQYIIDATNRGELKQVERELIRDLVSREGDTVNVKDFAKKVKAELLPLKISPVKYPHYESTSLSGELKGDIANYSENIYESPIKTSAADVHFRNANAPGYFGHTRIEDMADNKTRRVIEVQSDLYQKGNLENMIKSKLGSGYKANPTEIGKLNQYNDPTAHFRMIREEIKKAAQDGKTKLQFPTGETAIKIEGLGESGEMKMFTKPVSRYETDDVYSQKNWVQPTPENLKEGNIIEMQEDAWIVTELLGDGKFKAIPLDPDPRFQMRYTAFNKDGVGVIDGVTSQEKLAQKVSELKKEGLRVVFKDRSLGETFDISGKVDANNPIYKFYEKDVAKYLNKFGGKRVIDDKGVSWIEVPIKKEQGKMPVEAFGKAQVGFLPKAAVATGTAAALSNLLPKKKNEKD